MTVTPPADTAVVTGLTLATVWVAKPLGVPVEILVYGAIFAFFGCLAKLSVDLWRLSRGAPGLTLSRVAGSFAAGMVCLLPATMVGFFVMNIFHVSIDKYGAAGFVAMGYGGPELVSNIYDFAYAQIIERVKKMFPGAKS